MTNTPPRSECAGHLLTDVPTAEELVQGLVDLMTVEQIGEDRFHGHRRPDDKGRVFGGQVMGQGLMAASRCVEAAKSAHSMHVAFMRPGDALKPIEYQVLRDYDGRSFATRRVVAHQGGAPILTMTVSFQLREDGLSHQEPMPDIPMPEDLPDEKVHWRAHEHLLTAEQKRLFLAPNAIETRTPRSRTPWNNDRREPYQNIWFRTVAPIGDDRQLNQSILAHISDMRLLGTSLMPHGRNVGQPTLQVASLDHVLWLHDDFRVDDWLLYSLESPWAGRGRGLNFGRFYSRDGRLVASTVQEGLIRPRD